MSKLEERIKAMDDKKDRKTILVVDDEKDVVKALYNLVGEEFKIEYAPSGEKALERLKKKEYDAVITDMVMPGMHGIEFVKEMKKRGHVEEVGVLTGNPQKNLVEEDVLAETGALDYIVKGNLDDIQRIRTSLNILTKATESKRKLAEVTKNLAESLEGNPFISQSDKESIIAKYIGILPSREKPLLKGKYVFLTGATGFLGKMLVKKFLEHDPDVNLILLTRDKKDKDGNIIIPYDKRLSIDERFSDRVVFVNGDLNQSWLGLNKEHRDIATQADEIWHSAASTAFEEQLRQETYMDNTLGIENLLDIAMNCKNLKLFNHISTAYVAGTLTYPSVAEEKIKIGGTGKNPYETSKHTGEILVAASGIKFRIFRPSIIIGDSVTGEADDKTMYGVGMAFIRYVSDARKKGEKELNVRIIMNEDTRKNFVCVDNVIDMMLKIREANKGAKDIFHLSNPVYTPVGEVFQAVARVLSDDNFKLNISYVNPPKDFGNELVKMEKPNVRKIVRELLPNATIPELMINTGLLTIYGPYMLKDVGDDPIFEQKNLYKVLPEYKVKTIDTPFLDFTFQKWKEKYYKE